METNKVIGYALLFIGILIIVLPLWQAYRIFSGASLPAQIFIKTVPVKINQNVSPIDIQGQVQNAIVKTLPLDYISNILNLSALMLLMWIFIYGGGKIAGIGVKLLNANKQ